MKTLYIDTHNDIHIAVLDEYNIIKEKKILDQKENSMVLMNTIIEVIDNNNFDQIIVINGPGSFTGVRLGVTIAKTLAYTKNIPIKTISFLSIMAICTEGKQKVVAFNDRNGYFVGYFNEENHSKQEFEYIKKSDFSSMKTSVTTSFNFDFKKIIDYSKLLNSTNPHNVKPIYVKKIEVEL